MDNFGFDLANTVTKKYRKEIKDAIIPELNELLIEQLFKFHQVIEPHCDQFKLSRPSWVRAMDLAYHELYNLSIEARMKFIKQLSDKHEH